MNSTRTTTLILGLSAFALACGQQPTPEEYDDIATGVAGLVSDNPGSETEAISDGMEAAHGEVPSGLSRSGMGSISGKRGTVDYSFEVTCQDAAGATLAPCDETTDSARLVLDVQGTIDTARYDAKLSRTGDWQIVGLTGETATLDGSGTFDVESEFMAIFRNETRTFVLDYDARYDAVQIRTADEVPVAGTIEYDVHAKQTKSRTFRDIEREIDVNAVVTFDGSGAAQLVLDGERRYSVDLKDGTVALESSD